MLSLGGNISHNDRKLYVYGFSAGGSYSKSKVNSNYASVKTQAGIYAGDEGYDIHIKEHTELTGGLHVYVYEQDVYVYISTNDKEISKVEFSDVDEINFIESIFKIKSKYLTYDLNFYTMESFVSFNL